MSAAVAESEQTEGERPKSRRKTLIVVVGVGAFCLLAGAAWLLGLLPLGHTSPHHGPQAAAARSMPEAVYVDMPEIMTNLDAGPHRIAFAKLQFKIETDQPGDAAKIRLATPRIVDMAATYLRAVRPEELRSDTGPYLLREALLQRAAVAVPDASVASVLFEELLVQ